MFSLSLSLPSLFLILAYLSKICSSDMSFFFFLYSGATHSALGDMKTITQESKASVTSAEKEKAKSVIWGEKESFFTLDEVYSVYANNKTNKSTREEIIVVAEPEPPRRSTPLAPRNSKIDAKPSSTLAEGEAQKKFGSAKAISSDQYFQDSSSDNAVSANYEYSIFLKSISKILSTY